MARTGLIGWFMVFFLLVPAGRAAGEEREDRGGALLRALRRLVRTEEKRMAAMKKRREERMAAAVSRPASAPARVAEEKEEKPAERAEGKEKGKVSDDAVPVPLLWGRDLQNMVSFDAEEEDVEQLIHTIRKAAGVNVVADKAAIDRGVKEGRVRKTITLRVDNMTLESALNWICRLSGLAWTIQDEAVFITTPDRIARKAEKMKIYDIRDIVLHVPDFPGPSIELNPGGGVVVAGP